MTDSWYLISHFNIYSKNETKYYSIFSRKSNSVHFVDLETLSIKGTKNIFIYNSKFNKNAPRTMMYSGEKINNEQYGLH